MFYSLTTPAGKNITIETNGYKTITGNQITNSGTVKMINSNTAQNPVYNYRGSDYYIVNSAGASLELDNIIINAQHAIDNSGTISVKDSEITASGNGIAGDGTVAIDNSTITASSTGISSSSLTISNYSNITGTSTGCYVSGGTVSIVDSTISSGSSAYYQYDAISSTITRATINGAVVNHSGTSTITNSTISRTGSRVFEFISNSGTMTLDTITATLSTSDHQAHNLYAISNSNVMNIDHLTYRHDVIYYISQPTFDIYNTGTTMTFDNSTIDIIGDGVHIYPYSDTTYYSVYNDSGDLNLNSTDINVELAPMSVRGLYNGSGNVVIHDGSLAVQGATVYGIYNTTGEVTIGEPEPSTSPDYGGQNANVDTQNPNIRAIGSSTGIGAHNDSGKVNFYDGRITASSMPFQPSEYLPTEAEYRYEPREYTDGDGYKYVILEWMLAP
jgi:hypothetical protein